MIYRSHSGVFDSPGFGVVAIVVLPLEAFDFDPTWGGVPSSTPRALARTGPPRCSDLRRGGLPARLRRGTIGVSGAGTQREEQPAGSPPFDFAHTEKEST